MSTKKPSQKKVVVSTRQETAQPANRSAAANDTPANFTFTRDTYTWMGIGFALVLLGMILMGGGHMPDPNTWDENIIYGFRRTVLDLS
ncbi:MAG: DUF3098 domain-containing protein [Saprospiraceae bacterium]